MTGFTSALCELLHTAKNIPAGSARRPLPGGNEPLERALVADSQVTTAQFDDAGLSPDGEVLAHEFARDAQHLSQLLLRQAQGRGAPVDQGNQLLGESGGNVQESRILDQAGGATQAGAEQPPDAKHRLGPLGEESAELRASPEDEVW